MSFIRALNSGPKWVEEANTDGLYVYSDGENLVYMPRREYEFVEVVMRMLEQSRELSDDDLEQVLHAFAVRLRWDESKERERLTTRDDVEWSLLDAYLWCEDNGFEDYAETLESIWRDFNRVEGPTGEPVDAAEADPDA